MFSIPEVTLATAELSHGSVIPSPAGLLLVKLSRRIVMSSMAGET
jgi:hypothetical protein